MEIPSPSPIKARPDPAGFLFFLPEPRPRARFLFLPETVPIGVVFLFRSKLRQLARKKRRLSERNFFSGIKQFPEKKTGLFDVRNDTGQRQQ